MAKKPAAPTAPQAPSPATPIPVSGGSYVVEDGQLRKTAGTEPADAPPPRDDAAIKE